jgi:predicted transcriptional regulator
MLKFLLGSSQVRMEKISISLRDEQLQHVAEREENKDETRSEAVRTLVDRGMNAAEREEKLRGRMDELERKKDEEIEQLRTEIDRLQRERRQILEQREENQELVRFAEEQRSLVSEQRDRRNAPVWRRAKWWVLGRGQEQGR